MRVLILVYEHLQSDLLELVLRRNGFEPILCSDPVNIRQELKTHAPQVLMIDTRLPNHNGIDVLRQLKEDRLLNNLYVIVLSSLGSSIIVKEAVEAGAQEFLVKPLDMDMLVARLKQVRSELADRTVSSTSTKT